MIRLAPWITLAIAIRFAAAWTHSSWFHPDEWFQTVEPANLHAFGFGYYAQEISLHLRNQSWPMLLAIPLKAAEWLAPGSIDFRIFALGFFIGLLDLSILWGWWKMTRARLDELKASGWSARAQAFWATAGVALLVLPWFSVYDSVNPRAEHASAIATWITLGALSCARWKTAGFAAAAIAAVRPPSLLLTVGFGFALACHSWRGPKKPGALGPRNPLLGYALGLAFGAFIFGIPDWITYGRPWESLWMYLQYNVFTGLSSLVFGEQGLDTYSEFFAWRWGRYGINAPVGISLAFLSIAGFSIGLKRFSPWAWGLLFYLAGHALTGHKEARFILPIDALLLWAALDGATRVGAWLNRPLRRLMHLMPTRGFALRAVFGAYVLLNLLLTLRAVWGETWVASGTYREIDRHLKTHADTCAIVTVKFPMSPLLPQGVPLGFVPMNRANPSFDEARNRGIEWQERKPECSASTLSSAAPNPILLHLHAPDQRWETEQACVLLQSGLLNLLPKSAESWALKKGLVSGVWYFCPAQTLNQFRSQGIARRLVSDWGKIPELPRLGTPGRDLIELALRTVPPPEPKARELFDRALEKLPGKTERSAEEMIKKN